MGVNLVRISVRHVLSASFLLSNLLRLYLSSFGHHSHTWLVGFHKYVFIVIYYHGLHQIRDGLKEKKLMEFSIKLAGWVIDAPIFH